jgi:hypothetical protein
MSILLAILLPSQFEKYKGPKNLLSSDPDISGAFFSVVTVL